MRKKRSEKRDLAFLLLDSDHKNTSEEIFLKLAKNEAPESSNVQQLLFLWGPRPKPKELKWLEDRFHSAPEIQKIAWLKILLQSGHRSIIGKIQRKTDQYSDEIRYQCLIYLTRRPKSSAFRTFLKNEIDNENSIIRIEKLAQLSNDTGNIKLAQTSYHKILSKDPGYF